MLPPVFDFLNGPVRQLVTQLYDTVGYLGVAFWVALESIVIPIPSELVLPFAGFLVGEGTAFEVFLTDERPTGVTELTAAGQEELPDGVVGLTGARSGRYLVLWLTALPPTDDGRFRGEVTDEFRRLSERITALEEAKRRVDENLALGIVPLPLG